MSSERKGNSVGTRSSTFGSPGRINHDASRFYGSRLYEGKITEAQKFIEQELPEELLNRFFTHSSELMHELPDSSVHLMITSPPYNVQKEYDENLTLEEYLDLLEKVFRETYRVLVTGGRACINIANLGRKPYIPLHAYVVEVMQNIGFLMRGEIIWNKAASASPSTAWGSWKSASNPVLRDVHEYILVFSKGSFSRKRENRENTIERDDFLAWTKSVWDFSPESAKRVGHPAPFPIELPHRLIQLYSFKEDIVLDPFSGSGTTALAAVRDSRNFVAYEVNEAYNNLGLSRLQDQGVSVKVSS